MSLFEILAAVTVAALGGGALGAVIVKWLNRDVDAATAMATRVTALGAIIDDLIASDARKAEQLASALERIDLLEERERHMLTRAAVHEAWDQMAFAVLVAQNPSHPPPPPLTAPKAAEHE